MTSVHTHRHAGSAGVDLFEAIGTAVERIGERVRRPGAAEAAGPPMSTADRGALRWHGQWRLLQYL